MQQQTSGDLPDKSFPWTRKTRTGWLFLVGLAVLLVLVWADARGPQEWAAAQDSPVESPLEPVQTPTPTREPRTVNEVIHPRSGDAIAGDTEIIGTALIVDFLRYDIHIARTGEDRWSWVFSSTDAVHDDVLVVLNTRGYADGRYDLRVRAVDMWGNFTEEFVRDLQIRNRKPPTPTPDPRITPAPRSPLPTPTPTPDMRARLPGGTGFYAPDFGAVLRGAVEIVGAVSGQFRNPLSRWDLAISPFNQEEWTPIASGTQTGPDLTLMTLDTAQYDDGLYDLRLRASYADGNFNDYFLRQLSFANQGDPQFAFMPRPGIMAPLANSVVSGIMPIVATVPADDLMHWELAWSRQGQEDWILLTTGDQPVREGELARLDLSQLPGGLYDLRLRIVRRGFDPQEYWVRGLQVEGMVEDLADEGEQNAENEEVEE